MANKLKVLEAALSQLAGLGRKIVPLAEEKVLQRITANAPDIAKSIQEYGGASFSPRLNRLLAGPDDYGHMMSIVKEDWPRIPVDRNNLDEVTQRIIEVAQTPELMKRLRRGENYGGWVDKTSNLAMDPSVRHLNRDFSILRGGRAKQDAGFSLMDADEYKLTDELKREALRRLLAEAAAGGGAVATGGYLGAQD
jgi:hypothetical protein